LLRSIERVDPSTHSMETSNGSMEASTGSVEVGNEPGGGTNEQVEGATHSMDKPNGSLERPMVLSAFRRTAPLLGKRRPDIR